MQNEVSTYAETLGIVVPCYNEELSFAPFMAALEPIERDMAAHGVDVFYVFVNDGSADATLERMKELRAAHERCHYVSFSRNFGKEAALLAGLNRVLDLGATLVAVMDVDLQDPPSLLPTMLERMRETDCDVVATYRSTRAGEPPVRSWFARRFYALINRMSDVEMRDGARDFRLMRACVAKAITDLPERNRFSKGLFAWVGFKTEWIGFENVPRAAGQTTWNGRQLALYAIDGIVAFSTAPLMAISVTALLMFLVAIIALVFIIVRAALFGDSVAGWPSMMCAIVLIGSLQMLGIGITGIYLSKAYSETKKRPMYLIREQD